MELFPSNNHCNKPSSQSAPLAERMRPRTIDEFSGQKHLLDQGKPLRRILESGSPCSMILWGPPGTGKTTLARLVAVYTEAKFIEYSAVLSGIAQIREVIKLAESHKRVSHKETILFIDEIHRFNKAQQDAFLPHIEKGTIVLIGATTENPSFEVIPALLSRSRVFTLKLLEKEEIITILRTAVEDNERGLGNLKAMLTSDAMNFIADYSGGDARVALGSLELAVELTEPDETGFRKLDTSEISAALQKKTVVYDKSGEHHFNIISALHKSLRGSDPDAALYWLARMIEGGEDPLYIARRLIRFASEDIGLADPRAITLAISARDSYHFLGSPEGDLALAECVIYLACAPKSNSVYTAWSAARKRAVETSHLPVPLSIRNAPTRLMSELGYAEGYQYDHENAFHYSGQDFLPGELSNDKFYIPGKFGYEIDISKRIEWWKGLKQKIKEKRNPASDR